MIPFPAEEILSMLAILILRFGLPVALVLLLGSLAQRMEITAQASGG